MSWTEKGAHGSRTSPKGIQPLRWNSQEQPWVSGPWRAQLCLCRAPVVFPSNYCWCWQQHFKAATGDREKEKILEWFLPISAPSYGFCISAPTWKQDSYRLTSQMVLEHLQNHWGFCRKLFTRKKKIRVGLPENTKSQFLTWCLYSSLQHKPAMNCSKENCNCRISQI